MRVVSKDDVNSHHKVSRKQKAMAAGHWREQMAMQATSPAEEKLKQRESLCHQSRGRDPHAPSGTPLSLCPSACDSLLLLASNINLHLVGFHTSPAV